MSRSKETKKNFEDNQTVDLFAGPGGLTEEGSTLDEIAQEWLSPYKKLAKRFGINETNFDLRSLVEPSRQWIEEEIVPLFNAEVLALFNEIKYSIHWDQLASEINEAFERGINSEELNKVIFGRLTFWAKFVWTMENFVYEKLTKLGVTDIGMQEEIILRAYPERKHFKTVDELLAAIVNGSQQQATPISLARNSALAVVPKSYTMAIQDNQLVTPIIGMKAGEGIALTFKQTKFNGQVLAPWDLKIAKVNETAEQVTEADLAIAFAACEVAKNNQVTDLTGRFSHDSFTIPEVVALVFGVRPNNIKPDSVYYQFVEESIHKLTENRYSYNASQLVSERGVVIPDGFLLASKNAPLLECTEVQISKGGKAIDAFILKGSFVYSIIQMLGWRNTIQMRPEFMPKNVREKRHIILAFEMLSKASNRGPASNNVNTVYLSSKDREGKYSLYQAMASEGWIDIDAMDRTPTNSERQRDLRQRKAIEKVLAAWKESGCFSVVENPNRKDRKLTHYWARLDRSKDPNTVELLEK